MSYEQSLQYRYIIQWYIIQHTDGYLIKSMRSVGATYKTMKIKVIIVNKIRRKNALEGITWTIKIIIPEESRMLLIIKEEIT